jgi:hypothetical protein
MRIRLLTAATLAALALAGCQDPHQPALARAARPGSTTAPSAARAQAAPDTAPQLDPAAKMTPRRALAAFCGQWINWSARTIERQQRRLAALAGGRLARELAAEAAVNARHPPLQRAWLAARGRVLTVQVMPGGSVRAGSCVAVEQHPGEGEGARAGRRVYLATLARGRRGWAITRWVPQP